MPRLQVYLPDRLYAFVKDNQLPASQLLQSAVEAEMERRLKLAELDAYLAEVRAETGPPTPADEAEVQRIMQELSGDALPGERAPRTEAPA